MEKTTQSKESIESRMGEIINALDSVALEVKHLAQEVSTHPQLRYEQWQKEQAKSCDSIKKKMADIEEARKEARKEFKKIKDAAQNSPEWTPSNIGIPMPFRHPTPWPFPMYTRGSSPCPCKRWPCIHVTIS